MPFRELLTEFDDALSEYSSALAKARDRSLTVDERLQLIQSCDPLWERVKAVRKKIEELNDLCATTAE
jgi:hypothetical protein